MSSLPFAEKYASRNPVSRYLISRFIASLFLLVNRIRPRKILEIGCGEGFLALALAKQGYFVHGIDIRKEAVQFASRRASETGLACKAVFEFGDIYDVSVERFDAELLVCCEVLEHLEFPEKALSRLARFPVGNVVFSVPREPLWRSLNMCRFKYLGHLGNTPGHVNHWSRKSFIEFLRAQYVVEEVLTPVPWTMALCRKKKI